jgi:AcrR family transcriptional regulator
MLTKSEASSERVDPRSKRTRQLILNAFSELIAEKGFDSITVQEIADRATVNRATFYAHFEDKYMLLDDSFAEWFNQVLHSKLPTNAPYSALNLRLLIQTICEFLGDVREHCVHSIGAQFDSLVERQVKMQLYDFLLGWQKASTPNGAHGQDQRELRATVTSWAIYGAAMRWSQSDHKQSPAEFARQALPIIMAGFDEPAGMIPSQNLNHIKTRN